jgi:hypothetical protein
MSSKRNVIIVLLLLLLAFSVVAGQKKKPTKKNKPEKPVPQTELAKLRDDYVTKTKDYKASLEKLLTLYEKNVSAAEAKLATTKKLLDEGLVAKMQVEEQQRIVDAEKAKVDATKRQIAAADTQMADVLVEAEADEQLAKNLKLAKNSLVRTTSFMRFNGTGGWSLGDAWKIQRFFSDTFHKELPIAVFGQGAIHDRWRLDHHNAMDIQLHPDGAEGQALLNFLQKNGIPFSAFRSAIPGTATGPHIHIGRPSHRY